MSRKRETIGQIIARAPEDADQLGRYEEGAEEMFAHFELLLNDLRRGIAPHDPDDCNMLADIIEAHVFLTKPRGGIAQSHEAKAAKAANETAIYKAARQDRDRLMADGNMSRAKATEQKVKDIHVLLPHLAETTIKSRLNRRR